MRRLTLLLVVAGLTGCNSTPTVIVDPATVTIEAGGVVTFHARVDNVSDQSVTWSVGEAAAGNIDSTGRLTAGSTPGTFHVTATSVAAPSAHSSASVTITPRAGNIMVTVSPATATLSLGASYALTASVTGTQDTAVTWSVVEAGGGTVTSTGTYTAPNTTGTYHVKATSHADPTRAAQAAISVVDIANGSVMVTPHASSIAVGATLQLTAQVNGVTPTTVTWSATCGSVSTQGLFTAPATAGTCSVTATSTANPALSDSATITVTNTSTVSVTVSPSSANLATGGTQKLTATVTGTSTTGVTWAVEESVGGQVTQAGLYTAPNTAGTFHVTATSVADTTKLARATMTVALPTVAVTISPTAATVQVATQKQFASAVTGTTNSAVTWSIQEGTTGGSINGSGLYTAPSSAGIFHIVATSQADLTKSASATVTVTTAPVVSVNVTPASPTVKQGATQTMTATVSGASNPSVTWSIQEGAAGGSITSSGLYTAPTGAAAAGTWHVVATSVMDPTATGIALVSVPAVTVTVSPPTSSINVGGSAAFSATVGGAQNTSVTWSVQEGAAGGAVTSSGSYTAPLTAGTYHVAATSVVDTTAQGTATVTVNAVPVAITVSPKTPNIATGAQQQFTASVQNTTNTAVTWSVQEPDAGVVTASGLYTAPQTMGTYHVSATSVADTSKSDTATVLVCNSGALCTPANPCMTGTLSCSPTTGATCNATTTNAPNGSICGTNQVCNAGSCVSCTAGQACTSPDPCALGTTSCTTGTSQCVAGGANPAKPNGTNCTPTPVPAGGGTCQAGVCTCPAGSAFYQGDCQACPAFVGTTVYVNADTTKGSDNVCCGTSQTPGFGGPCLTMTQAIKNIKGTNWSVDVTGDALRNVSNQETYPIHLSNGVTVFLGSSFVKGSSGQHTFMADVDTTTVHLVAGTIGVDSAGRGGRALSALYVGTTASGLQSSADINSPTIRSVENGVVVDGGRFAGTTNPFTMDRIANAGVLCRSDTRQNVPSSASRLYGTVNSAAYGLFAGQGCDAASGGSSTVQLTIGPSSGTCPSPKPIQYGLWLEGNARVAGIVTINCASADAVSLRTNTALSSNSPTLSLLNGSARHSGCAGLYVEAGTATVQGMRIRSNHFGIWLNSPGSSTDPAQSPIALNGQVSPGSFNRNELLCNGAAEPGDCSTGAYATKGFSILNRSGYTIDASNNYWGDSPISKCTCDTQLQNCTCSGGPFGQTTPPDAISIVNAPYNATTPTTPAVVTTGYALATTPACN